MGLQPAALEALYLDTTGSGSPQKGAPSSSQAGASPGALLGAGGRGEGEQCVGVRGADGWGVGAGAAAGAAVARRRVPKDVDMPEAVPRPESGGGLGEGVHERVSKRMEGRDAAVPGSGEEGVGEEVEVAAAGVVRGRWQRVVGIRATGEECDEASMLVWYCIAFVLWVFGSFDWYEKDWVCGADEHRSICA